MGHGGVGVEGKAESRLRRDPSEEEEERRWRKREGIGGDERDDLGRRD